MYLSFMTERTIEECLENCLRLAKNSLEVYDEMEKHNVSYAEMYRAKRTGTLLDYCYQRELKAGTAAITTLMSIDDFVDDRRSYYETVVEHLIPIVAMHKKGASQLNSTLTLDTYRKSAGNSAALQMAKEVINSPGKRENNPFLLIGDFGCGKTHLVNAIGNAINKEHPQMTVFYVRGDEFKRQYMDAVKSNRLTEFKNRYDKVDVLILDNLQDLVGPGTQNCFFHVMDQMYQKDKQIVLTCSQGLDDMKGMLEERLIEHCRWGKAITISKKEE